MINVEGNYEEIVKWMDEHPVDGVGYFGSHGECGYDDEGNFVSLNVGFFSVNPALDNHPDDDCAVCRPGEAIHGLYICNFDTMPSKESKEFFKLTDEELSNSHLIYF